MLVSVLPHVIRHDNVVESIGKYDLLYETHDVWRHSGGFLLPTLLHYDNIGIKIRSNIRKREFNGSYLNADDGD